MPRLFRTLLNVDNTLGGVRWARKGRRLMRGGNVYGTKTIFPRVRPASILS